MSNHTPSTRIARRNPFSEILSLVIVSTFVLSSLQDPCLGYDDCLFCLPSIDPDPIPLCYACSNHIHYPDYVPKNCDFCNNVIPECRSCSYPTGITQCEICGTGGGFYLLSLNCETCSQSCPGESYDSDQDGRCDCNGLSPT
jgi:hypothetical protein